MLEEKEMLDQGLYLNLDIHPSDCMVSIGFSSALLACWYWKYLKTVIF